MGFILPSPRLLLLPFPFLHFSLPSKYVHPARIPTYCPIYWLGVENALTTAFFNNSTKLIYFVKKQNKTQVLYSIFYAPKERSHWHLKSAAISNGGGGGLVTKSCLTLTTPWTVDSSVHGILQARLLEWVAISFSSYIK